MADVADDSHEEQVEASRRATIYRVIVSVTLTLISIGQFNDTKELVLATYEDIQANFTHHVEYERLSLLNIGRTIPYIENQFGPPEVIKRSKVNPEVSFQYYSIEKAIVTLFNHHERVAGFVVIPIASDFYPEQPYAPFSMDASPLSAINTGDGGFYLDANNLVYYAESEDLGKQFLFLQRVTGFVEYGGLERTLNGTVIEPATTIEDIDALNDLLVSGLEDELVDAIMQFRASQTANFYGYTELDPALVTESLLTRIEFDTYFGGIYD